MKHAREDYDRIQDPAGKIPANEPVFLLRGQDPYAAAAVRAYAVTLAPLNPEMAAMAWQQAERMDRWTPKKQPDVPHQTPKGAPPPTPSKSADTPEGAFAKLDGDSLDAIVEVVGEGANFRAYNEGKSFMRTWFLRRLARLWNLPAPDEPVTLPAVERHEVINLLDLCEASKKNPLGIYGLNQEQMALVGKGLTALIRE